MLHVDRFWQLLALAAGTQLLLFIAVSGPLVWLNWKRCKRPGSIKTAILVMGPIVFLGVFWHFLRVWKQGPGLAWPQVEVFIGDCMEHFYFFVYASIGFFAFLFVLGLKEGLFAEPDQPTSKAAIDGISGLRSNKTSKHDKA